MYLHANAKLGLAGRLALVRAVEEGASLKAAAAAFSVSPATAHRWWHRWLDGGRQVSALVDRSSRPRFSPRQLAPELAGRIVAVDHVTFGIAGRRGRGGIDRRPIAVVEADDRIAALAQHSRQHGADIAEVAGHQHFHL